MPNITTNHAITYTNPRSPFISDIRETHLTASSEIQAL